MIHFITPVNHFSPSAFAGKLIYDPSPRVARTQRCGRGWDSNHGGLSPRLSTAPSGDPAMRGGKVALKTQPTLKTVSAQSDSDGSLFPHAALPFF